MGEPLVQLTFLYMIFLAIVIACGKIIEKYIKKKLRKIVYTLVLISPILLYIPTEINTLLYGNEFKGVKIETGFNLPVIYYKVLSIDSNKAELFYVEGENGSHDVGEIYRFVKENGKWTFTGWWQTVWTNSSGNAADFTVPPYF